MLIFDAVEALNSPADQPSLKDQEIMKEWHAFNERVKHCTYEVEPIEDFDDFKKHYNYYNKRMEHYCQMIDRLYLKRDGYRVAPASINDLIDEVLAKMSELELSMAF